MTPVALVIVGGGGIGADCARRLADDGFAIGVMSSLGRGEALALELGRLG